MKPIVLILAIIFLVVSSISGTGNYYGQSKISIERGWIIGSQSPGQVELNGTLISESENQKILNLTLDTRWVLAQDPQTGELKFTYLGEIKEGENRYDTDSIVEIKYEPKIFQDSPAPPLPVKLDNERELIIPDSQIAETAHDLRIENSSLNTIRNITDYVNKYVQYDIEYWGKSLSAQKVYQIKKGVCVEYTHLLISMLESEGYETRYISGYVKSQIWQPHAWAEVKLPTGEWIMVDPTFGEIGTLDNTHIAIGSARDQSDIYDSLLSYNDATINRTKEKITILESEKSDPKVDLDIAYDSQKQRANITITNNEGIYKFGSYSYTAHDVLRSEIILLAPYEKRILIEQINQTMLPKGFTYLLKIKAQFNDKGENKELRLDLPKEKELQESEIGQLDIQKICPMSAILGLFSIALFFKVSKQRRYRLE
ncbi:transglutaminase domain-containing protein [Candidatus Micrarchaeota archaeon]|nr:transglutaminase domain-containing protein [Candidatus Micrarchaeota archaeon]